MATGTFTGSIRRRGSLGLDPQAWLPLDGGRRDLEPRLAFPEGDKPDLAQEDRRGHWPKPSRLERHQDPLRPPDLRPRRRRRPGYQDREEDVGVQTGKA